MIRRTTLIVMIAALAIALSGCGHKKVANPIANLDSKQPDKVLYDRAVDLLKHGKYDQARTTLQVLINTYPDSEFIARAKLTIADAWYLEGNTTALGQAEIEYKDFQTFFPNMPEAAEAQMKVAGIHYRQMQKPDRDFTHARRAEDEYRQMIQQYPDSRLVPEAKARLREVQEVLAEREFRIEIDGGVGLETVASIVQSGAEILVAGNAIFGSGDARLNTERLLKAAQEATLAKV